jgi:uncharacterized protein YbjT (DUF2867 family)
MVSPILVTGGTGTSGRHVVRRLREAGRDIRVLSRHQHASGDGIECVTGDLLRGEGIESAVAGAEIIVHCAGNEKGDEEATGNLVGAGVACRGVAFVYISVIGADRIPIVSGIDRLMFSYFASKLGRSGSWPTWACRGRHYVPPSSMTSSWRTCGRGASGG